MIEQSDSPHQRRQGDALSQAETRAAHTEHPHLAIVAVGRLILIIILHLLADPTTRFSDLGPV